MYRKFSDHKNEKEQNLSKVYYFKNDFNLDLKSSTISFDKLFQSFTTPTKKRMFKTVNF